MDFTTYTSAIRQQTAARMMLKRFLTVTAKPTIFNCDGKAGDF
jgi:ribosomal protein L33